MSEMIHLSLPDHILQKAREIAAFTHREVEDVLLEWLKNAAEDTPVESLPDDQVLALAEAQMDEDQYAELSELLAQQRESRIDDEGRTRLDHLMGIYRQGLVRKSEALRVAVQRGLRPPLHP